MSSHVVKSRTCHGATRGSDELPAGKILILGVVSHATDLVEHPELVADRIITFAEIVGQDTVVAGTDCSLGGRGHPQIAWAKLRAPTRWRGDREQDVVELNSKVPCAG